MNPHVPMGRGGLCRVCGARNCRYLCARHRAAAGRLEQRLAADRPLPPDHPFVSSVLTATAVQLAGFPLLAAHLTTPETTVTLPAPTVPRPALAACPVHPDRPVTRWGLCDSCRASTRRYLRAFDSHGRLPQSSSNVYRAISTVDLAALPEEFRQIAARARGAMTAPPAPVASAHCAGCSDTHPIDNLVEHEGARICTSCLDEMSSAAEDGDTDAVEQLLGPVVSTDDGANNNCDDDSVDNSVTPDTPTPLGLVNDCDDLDNLDEQLRLAKARRALADAEVAQLKRQLAAREAVDAFSENYQMLVQQVEDSVRTHLLHATEQPATIARLPSLETPVRTLLDAVAEQLTGFAHTGTWQQDDDAREAS